MFAQYVPQIAHRFATSLQHGEPDSGDELSLISVSLHSSAPLMDAGGAALLHGATHAAARRPVAANEAWEEIVAPHLVDRPGGDSTTLHAQRGAKPFDERLVNLSLHTFLQCTPDAEELARGPFAGESLAEAIERIERRFAVPDRR